MHTLQDRHGVQGAETFQKVCHPRPLDLWFSSITSGFEGCSSAVGSLRGVVGTGSSPSFSRAESSLLTSGMDVTRGGGGDAGSISSVSWQHSSLFPSSLREEEREIFIPLVMMLPCTTIELARSYHCYQISGLMGFTQVAGRRKVCWGSTLALKCQLMTEGEECKEFYIRDFLPFCHVLDWGDHFVFKKEKRGKNPHMYTIHVLQCCRKILKEPCFYCNWFLSLGLK